MEPRGIAWYLAVLRGTLWYFCDALRCFLRCFVALGYLALLRGTLWYFVVFCGTVWYFAVRRATLRYVMAPCGTVEPWETFGLGGAGVLAQKRPSSVLLVATRAWLWVRVRDTFFWEEGKRLATL